MLQWANSDTNQIQFPTITALDPIKALQEEQKSFANQQAKEPGVGRQDAIRAGTAVVILGIAANFVLSSEWLADHAQLGLIGIFVLGYVAIIFEELFEFNKAGVALLMSTAMWITYAGERAKRGGICDKKVRNLN